jgi:ArsR family transcriptional regulator
MGLAKTEIYSEEINELAILAKALAHPARIAILQHLFDVKSCICGDLVLEIGLAQATISQHLKELKQLGLIKGSIEGTKVCYCLNTEKLAHMQSLINHFLNQSTINNSCC